MSPDLYQRLVTELTPNPLAAFRTRVVRMLMAIVLAAIPGCKQQDTGPLPSERGIASKSGVAPLARANIAPEPLGDNVLAEERIGGIKLGSNEADVIAALGVPPRKTSLGAEADVGDVGDSAWIWPGLAVGMVKGDDGKVTVAGFELKPPCMLMTSRGIKIGSPAADVTKHYLRSAEDDGRDPHTYLVRSRNGGETFTLDEGRVIGIDLTANLE